MRTQLARPIATLACAAALACAQTTAPDAALQPLWPDYQALPAHRAIAVAGELRSERWVAGMAGGHASPEAAEEAALRECARRRLERRMQDPCLAYAIDDTVVWPR